MKLYISSEGLLQPIESDLNQTLESLRKAQYHYLYCPASFSRAGDVKNLREEISEITKEIYAIKAVIKKTEKRYTSQFDQKERKVQYVSEKRIVERNGVHEAF